jgi:hypothetical protein
LFVVVLLPTRGGYCGRKTEWRFPLPRHADFERIRQLQKAIEENPGHKPGFFARLLHWQREKVNRGLVTLNDEGMLLYEDDKGRLWRYSQEDVL